MALRQRELQGRVWFHYAMLAFGTIDTSMAHKQLLCWLLCVVLATIVAGSPTPGLADTLLVPGNYPTIQSAVDAAAGGDSILVASGTYVESIRVKTNSITLISMSKGGATIRHASSMEWAPALSIVADSAIVSGFNLERSDAYGPVVGLWGESFQMEGCVADGGRPAVGFYLGDGSLVNSVIRDSQEGIVFYYGARGLLEGCDLESNWTSNAGGALTVFVDPGGTRRSEVTLKKCRFSSNRAELVGGAMALGNSTGPIPSVVVEECVFDRNEAASGAAIYSVNTDLTIASCTFVRNTVVQSSLPGAVIGIEGFTTAVFNRSIIAFNDGRAVRCGGGAVPALRCCDIYGNVDSGFCGQDLGYNSMEDPLFCGLADGDFRLRMDSPCSPPQSLGDCGLIGALPAACVVPVSPVTWGAIKHRYTREGRVER